MNDDAKPGAGLHAIVHGRVQGVNFRYFTATAARRLGLRGWVANRWDSTVEVVAEGNREALKELLAFLHRGPPYSMVERVDARWRSTTGKYPVFTVRN